MISFDLVKKQVSDLFIAFENIQTEAKQTIDEAKSADLHRKEANQRLDKREKEIAAESKRLEEERSFLINARLKQKEKELQLVDFEKKKKESETLIEGAEKKLSEATEAMKKLEQMKTDYNTSIKDKVDDLKKRESLLDRSEAIDRERKLLLDAREERIKATETRLQRFTA